MRATTEGTAENTDYTIRRYRLLAYRIIVPISVLAIALYWYRSRLLGESDPFEVYGYPVLLAIFGSAAVMLFVYPRMLDRLELFGFLTFVVYNILGLYYILLRKPSDLATLGGIGLWFPFFFIMAYAMLPRRRAIAVTLSIYALLLLPGAYLFWRDGPEPWTSGQVYEYLETLYVATGLYLPLLYAIAVLRESYQLVSMRAARLERDADIDALTTIPNRRALTRTLERALALTHRHPPRPLSVILFDLDRFKGINDTYGHPFGDTVLVMVTRIVSEQLRGSDVFGRWGGEEFMIVTPETDLEAARQLAERLRTAIAGQAILREEPVTASFGVARNLPGEALAALFARADAALYAAKDGGRNRVELADANTIARSGGSARQRETRPQSTDLTTELPTDRAR